MTVNPAHLTRTAPPTKHTPDLICAFCPRIRSFKTITGLWSHVIHKHADIPTEARLENIRQSGILWREYWFIHAHGGKNDALRSKLEEITTESFNWDSVLAWNIRWHYKSKVQKGVPPATTNSRSASALNASSIYDELQNMLRKCDNLAKIAPTQQKLARDLFSCTIGRSQEYYDLTIDDWIAQNTPDE